jgi:class 3 adenylate cyclase
MGLKEDLESEVGRIFRERWTERDGRQVPDADDLLLDSNDAVNLDATVLYADMSDSTKLVDSKRPSFAAEVYKAYLTCAARIVKDNGGTITAYDGDRVMAVFIGDTKNTTAAITALKINYAVLNIINPANKNLYGENSYTVSHTIGIDTSPLYAARIGVRNDNDLVWVGRAANYAAKMAAIKNKNKVFISDAVFGRLREDAKFGGTPRQLMWEPCQWTEMNNMSLHRSSWWWQV